MRNATGVVRDEACARWWGDGSGTHPDVDLILLVRADDVRVRGGREHRKRREGARFRVERARDPDREWVPRDDQQAPRPPRGGGPAGKKNFVSLIVDRRHLPRDSSFPVNEPTLSGARG